MVVIVSHVSGVKRLYKLPRSAMTIQEVLTTVKDREGGASDGVQLQSNGRVLQHDDVVEGDMTVIATLQHKEYVGKKAEREKMSSTDKLAARPKHVFDDKTYFEEREKMEQNLYDALEKGQKAGSSGSKSIITSEGPIKRAKMNGFDDLDDSSSEEESGNEEL